MVTICYNLSSTFIRATRSYCDVTRHGLWRGIAKCDILQIVTLAHWPECHKEIFLKNILCHGIEPHIFGAIGSGIGARAAGSRGAVLLEFRPVAVAKVRVILLLKARECLHDVKQIGVWNSCDPQCLRPIDGTQADKNFRMVHALPLWFWKYVAIIKDSLCGFWRSKGRKGAFGAMGKQKRDYNKLL